MAGVFGIAAAAAAAGAPELAAYISKPLVGGIAAAVDVLVSHVSQQQAAASEVPRQAQLDVQYVYAICVSPYTRTHRHTSFNSSCDLFLPVPADL
jgi:hypothetical protein